MRTTSTWERVAAIALGTLFAFLFLEVCLQGVALIVRATGREAPVAWMTGNFRILCLGDSNTYGLYLDPSEAYPQQLEAVWREQGRSPAIEVLNLGIPGTNSSLLVRNFPSMLETFRPDLVIVMVGVNDFWTQPFDLEEGEGEGTASRLWTFVKSRSRLYRFGVLVGQAFDSRELEVIQDADSGQISALRYGDREFGMGFKRVRGMRAGDAAGLERNLATLVRQAGDFGTELVFMNYPSNRKFYAIANRLIREVARASQTPLLELLPLFASECATPACPELLFPDNHPKTPGYRLIAEALARRLAELSAL